MFPKRRDPQPPQSQGQPGKTSEPTAATGSVQAAPPEQANAQAQPVRSESDEMRDMWSAMAALLDNTTVRADGSSADASAPYATQEGATVLPPYAQAPAASTDQVGVGAGEEPVAAQADGADATPQQAAPHQTAPQQTAPLPVAPAAFAAAATTGQNTDPGRWAPPSLLPPGSGPSTPIIPVTPIAPATPVAPQAPTDENPGPLLQPGASGVGPQLLPAPDETLFAAPEEPPYVAPYQPSGAPTAFVLREPGSPFTMPAGLDQNAVTLRGRSDGIAIEMGSGKWEDLLQLLSYRLEQTDGFFSNGYVIVDVGTRQMTEAELDSLARVLGSYSMHTGLLRSSAERTFQAALALGIPCAQVALDGTVVNEAMPAQAEDNTWPFFVYRGSLRSGQQLFRPEHIMIMGDVNPGAEVSSSGDILVWGRLRGVAHAGAQGNGHAIIAALDLDPVQLRIASVVAAAQAGQSASGGPRWGSSRSAERRPEIARLANGRLLIEAWDDVKSAGAPLLKRRRA